MFNKTIHFTETIVFMHIQEKYLFNYNGRFSHLIKLNMLEAIKGDINVSQRFIDIVGLDC